MSLIKQQTQLTKAEIFINQINVLYANLKFNHTILMSIWTKPESEIIETLTGLGVYAKDIFIASSTIQGLLKTFDANYEIIYPYRWNMSTKTKILLTVNFNEDGSFKDLVEK